MRLKMIQTILLTAFVLSGVLFVLNHSVDATEPALPYPTETSTQFPLVLDGPDIHITLPGIPLERPNIMGLLLGIIMVGAMSGFVGSLWVSKNR